MAEEDCLVDPGSFDDRLDGGISICALIRCLDQGPLDTSALVRLRDHLVDAHVGLLGGCALNSRRRAPVALCQLAPPARGG